MRAFTGAALDEDAAAVFLYDSIRQSESQTRSLSGFLRGEEGIVNAGDMLRGDAYARVAEVDNQRGIDRACVYREPAAAGHRVARVQDQVHKDLLQLRSAAVRRREALTEVAHDLELGVAQLRL